ncbi:hypothetical protein NPIL_96611, partial [Nephila pilipes]
MLRGGSAALRLRLRCQNSYGGGAAMFRQAKMEGQRRSSGGGVYKAALKVFVLAASLWRMDGTTAYEE